MLGCIGGTARAARSGRPPFARRFATILQRKCCLIIIRYYVCLSDRLCFSMTACRQTRGGGEVQLLQSLARAGLSCNLSLTKLKTSSIYVHATSFTTSWQQLLQSGLILVVAVVVTVGDRRLWHGRYRRSVACRRQSSQPSTTAK